MAEIGWNRMKMTDWMAMAGAVSALVVKASLIHLDQNSYRLDPPVLVSTTLALY